jgi:hypothetical protein
VSVTLSFDGLVTDKKHELSIGSIAVQFLFPNGKPVPDAAYECKLSNGDTRRGTTDREGRLLEGNIPAGVKAEIRLVEHALVARATA